MTGQHPVQVLFTEIEEFSSPLPLETHEEEIMFIKFLRLE